MGIICCEADTMRPICSKMRILESIREEFETGCLAGKNVLLCTHATEATVEFIQTLLHLGTSVFYIPIEYSTDSVCVENIRDLNECVVISYENIPDIASKIDVIIEDGMRISSLYDEKWNVRPGIFSIEQTTNGFFPKFGAWMVKKCPRVYHIHNTKYSKNDHIYYAPKYVLRCRTIQKCSNLSSEMDISWSRA